jgi:putative MATE family efflux protein
MTRDMTKGRPLPIIIKFCLPVLLGTVFQQFYNVADTMIIGRYIGAEEPLAAVGTTGPLNFLVLGFVIGICNGFCIPVAQRFGAGDIKEMRRFAANAVYLCAIFAVVITTLTMLFTRQLLQLIDVPETIIELSYSYIIMIFMGIPSAIAFNIQACLLRALGDSKSPLYFLAIASLVNVIADLVFILVFGWGLMGAGFATVVAQTVSAVLCFIHIRRNFPILRFKKDELKFSPVHARKLFNVGVPMGLQFSVTAIGSMILQSAVNRLNDAIIIASLTTGNRISLLLFQPMEAVGITMATYCGQNLGAKKLERIKQGLKISLIIQLIYSFFIGIAMWFLGRYMAAVFVGFGQTQIMDYVGFQLKVSGAGFWSIGVLLVMRNSLQGLGYSVMAMLAGVSELVARVIVAVFLVERFGFYGVCFAGVSSWLLADLVLIPAYFIVMKKLRRKIAEDDNNSSADVAVKKGG